MNDHRCLECCFDTLRPQHKWQDLLFEYSIKEKSNGNIWLLTAVSQCLVFARTRPVVFDTTSHIVS